MATTTTNPFGGSAAGSTGGMFGGGMWGGGYGMQQPSPYGGYGGFGGGMPYGGGYGMQSPYGAPGGYGGGYGGYSPYGAAQGYGGYGMQSPYASPYGMASQYGPQPSYGMPQQQSNLAAGAAPQAASPNMIVDPNVIIDEDPKNNFKIGGSTTQTNKPWEEQGDVLQQLWAGRDEAGKLIPTAAHGPTTGASAELSKQQELGPLGFDPSSEAALQRMQALAGGANPLLDASLGATQDITSGQAGIGTGGMFGNLYQNPGIQNAGQYQDMYSNPNIGGIGQYGRMAGQNAIGNAGQYSDIYGQQQGAGSLGQGMFGQIGRGDLVNANPYREQAIQQAMADTGDQVKATMSSRGRYGSDAYGDAMGRALGQVATQARMQGYDTDTANMMAAAQARSGEGLARGTLGLQAAQGLSGIQGQNYGAQLSALQGMNAAQQMQNQQRMAAASGLTGVQGQNWQNQLGALQGLTGVQGQNIANRLQGAGMAPAMQGLRYDDAGRLLQAGATREQMAQQQRDFGWDQLNRFSTLAGNVPGTAGTSKDSGAPWWQNALGMAGIASGIWGQATGGA